MSVRPVMCLLALLAVSAIGCDRPSASATSAPSSATADDSRDQTSASGRSGGVAETTFDDLKFEMEKSDPFERSLLTEKVEGLFGKRIRIRGYMFPTLKKRGLTQFVLVRDNLECCFGPGAALFDCVLVHMQDGATAEYSIRPIAVTGTLRFEEVIGPDGNHLAIYRLDGEQVN